MSDEEGSEALRTIWSKERYCHGGDYCVHIFDLKMLAIPRHMFMVKQNENRVVQ